MKKIKLNNLIFHRGRTILKPCDRLSLPKSWTNPFFNTTPQDHTFSILLGDTIAPDDINALEFDLSRLQGISPVIIAEIETLFGN